MAKPDHLLTEEQFAEQVMRFGKAVSAGDSAGMIATQSVLLLHDKAQREALQQIMDELGVPQPDYPQPVANAYEIAEAARG